MDQKTLPVDGLLIHYNVVGRGPDVVFVHGWAASQRMWGHVITELSAHFRCWTLDLPGCGDSDRPVDHWYSIPNFTALVRGFLVANGLRRVRLVGHSMGGMISLNLAARHPELIEQLVAINPVVTGNSHLRRLAHPGRRRQVLQWLLRVSPRVLEPLLSTGTSLHVQGVHHIRRRTEDFFKVSPGALLSSGRAIVAYDLSPQLPRIAAPTLVIVGDRDLNVPTSEGRLAARQINGARLHVMRAGHMATDDRPTEVVQQLRGFFA
jgi:pimeloyl-ACP methyl ester carboxylesterase